VVCVFVWFGGVCTVYFYPTGQNHQLPTLHTVSTVILSKREKLGQHAHKQHTLCLMKHTYTHTHTHTHTHTRARTHTLCHTQTQAPSHTYIQADTFYTTHTLKTVLLSKG